MKKSINFVFILILLFSIGIFYNLSSKTVLGGDEEKKNTSSTKQINTLTWYKYDEGLAKAKKEKKHILVAFYTNWCGWCKRMDKNTYGDEEVKKVLNKNYVPIKVNAESKDQVQVDGKKITETQLARELYKARSYPITWFLKVLNFIKDDLYDKMSFDEYLKNQDKKK